MSKPHLSPTQRAVLARMVVEGEIVVWTVSERHGQRASLLSQTVRFDTLIALRRLNYIARVSPNADLPDGLYRITPAGRAALEEGTG